MAVLVSFPLRSAALYRCPSTGSVMSDMLKSLNNVCVYGEENISVSTHPLCYVEV